MNNIQIAENYCKEIRKWEDIDFSSAPERLGKAVLKAKALQHKEDCERFLDFCYELVGRGIKGFAGVPTVIDTKIEDLSGALEVYKREGIQ